MAQGQQEPRGSTLTTAGRELWPESNPDRQRSVREHRYKLKRPEAERKRREDESQFAES